MELGSINTFQSTLSVLMVLAVFLCFLYLSISLLFIKFVENVSLTSVKAKVMLCSTNSKLAVLYINYDQNRTFYFRKLMRGNFPDLWKNHRFPNALIPRHI